METKKYLLSLLFFDIKYKQSNERENNEVLVVVTRCFKWHIKVKDLDSFVMVSFISNKKLLLY